MKRLLTLVATAALAACAAVGPDYERPHVPLPAAFPGGDAAGAAIAPDWWRGYGDPELERLVDKALGFNADIAQAVARVELAEAQVREAGGARWPALNAAASASRAQAGAGTPSNTLGRTITANDFQLALSASYEIDFWGRVSRSNEAARATLLASTASRDTVRLSVAALVAQGWFSLRALDEQIDATRRTLKTREDSARLVGLRLRAGTASRLEADQADILRADATVQLRELQRQRALAQSQLGLLAGDGSLQFAPAPLGATLPAVPPPGLPSSLLQRRPDVQAAEQSLVAANAAIGVARAAMFPSVSLTGALGQQSLELSDLLKAPARFWSLGVGLSLPLFDGGRNAARVDQAGARQRQAVAAYQQAVSTAFKEVADALANAAAARESAPVLGERAAAAERALKLAQARFDAGYAGYLEFLDAQRTATAAQLDVVRNRQAQLAASVDLVRALGGGWPGLPDAQR